MTGQRELVGERTHARAQRRVRRYPPSERDTLYLVHLECAAQLAQLVRFSFAKGSVVALAGNASSDGITLPLIGAAGGALLALIAGVAVLVLLRRRAAAGGAGASPEEGGYVAVAAAGSSVN